MMRRGTLTVQQEDGSYGGEINERARTRKSDMMTLVERAEDALAHSRKTRPDQISTVGISGVNICESSSLSVPSIATIFPTPLRRNIIRASVLSIYQDYGQLSQKPRQAIDRAGHHRGQEKYED